MKLYFNKKLTNHHALCIAKLLFTATRECICISSVIISVTNAIFGARLGVILNFYYKEWRRVSLIISLKCRQPVSLNYIWCKTSNLQVCHRITRRHNCGFICITTAVITRQPIIFHLIFVMNVSIFLNQINSGYFLNLYFAFPWTKTTYKFKVFTVSSKLQDLAVSTCCKNHTKKSKIPSLTEFLN